MRACPWSECICSALRCGSRGARLRHHVMHLSCTTRAATWLEHVDTVLRAQVRARADRLLRARCVCRERGTRSCGGREPLRRFAPNCVLSSLLRKLRRSLDMTRHVRSVVHPHLRSAHPHLKVGPARALHDGPERAGLHARPQARRGHQHRLNRGAWLLGQAGSRACIDQMRTATVCVPARARLICF